MYDMNLRKMAFLHTSYIRSSIFITKRPIIIIE